MTTAPLTTPTTLDTVREKARLLRIHSIRATTRRVPATDVVSILRGTRGCHFFSCDAL